MNGDESAKQAIEAMVFAERFINDGSPTGLTWKNSSSPATCPRRGPRSYLLPVLHVSTDVGVVIGTPPSAFFWKSGLLFPVHPDCVHLLGRSLHHQLIFRMEAAPLVVVPTASPRTVMAEREDWRGFLKLDYPFVLGRFKRGLSGEGLRHGIQVSRLLVDGQAEARGVLHFPETGAFEIPVDDERRSGVVFRGLLPIGPAFDLLLCVCSLFGRDYFADGTTKPKLIEYAERYGGIGWISDRVIRPLVTSFWKTVLEFGLWPEAHAQNIVFALQSDGSTGIVWRDCQGFWFDPELGAPGSMANGHYHVMNLGEEEAIKRRSFLYDWMFGTYVLDPLIAAAAAFYPNSERLLVDFVRDLAQAFLDSPTARQLLPANKSFTMPLRKPGAQRLALEESPKVHYR